MALWGNDQPSQVSDPGYAREQAKEDARRAQDQRERDEANRNPYTPPQPMSDEDVEMYTNCCIILFRWLWVGIASGWPYVTLALGVTFIVVQPDTQPAMRYGVGISLTAFGAVMIPVWALLTKKYAKFRKCVCACFCKNCPCK